MPLITTGTVTAEVADLDILVGASTDWSDVPVDSEVEVEVSAGVYERRYVTEIIDATHVRVHRDFSGAFAVRPYSMLMYLSGGNLSLAAYNAFIRETNNLRRLITGVEGQVATAVGGNPNTLRVTIEGSDAYVDGEVIVLMAPDANTGSVTLEKNTLGAKPFFKKVGEQFGNDEIDPNEYMIVTYDEAEGGYVAVGRGGVPGSSGSDGKPGGDMVEYNYSNTTTMADPGSGNIRLNHLTISSVTAAALDDLDRLGANVEAQLLTWDDSTSTIKGKLRIQRTTSQGVWAIFNITGLTDNSGWVQLALTYVGSSAGFSIANNDDLFASFSPVGDKGTTGNTGPAPTITGTSTTSLTVGTGTKVFTTQAGIAWILGQRLRAASDDGVKIMEGEITAYSGTSLTLEVDYTEDSGTHADWNISPISARGPTGPQGIRGAVGGAVSLSYNFDTDTAVTDPGTTDLKFNNAAPLSATRLVVSKTALGSVDASAILASLLGSTSSTNKGRIRISSQADDNKFWLGYLTSGTDQGTYYEFVVQSISVNLPSAFSAGEDVFLSFTEKGDVGSVSIGAGDVGTTQLADGAVTTAKIADSNVTNAKMANMAAGTWKGRATADGTGPPLDKTTAQLITELNITSLFAGYTNNFEIVASVGSNALTIALKTAAGTDPSASDPITAIFHNASSGAQTTRQITAATSIVVPNGGTFNTANNEAFRLWIGLFDDGGTLRLGLYNARYRNNNTIRSFGRQVISTTLIGTPVNALTWYTGTAIASPAPFLVLGWVEYSSGLATAGSYASVPSIIHVQKPGDPVPGSVLQIDSGSATAEVTVSTSTYTQTNLEVPHANLSSANIIEIEVAAAMYTLNAASPSAVFAKVHRDGTMLTEIPAQELYLSTASALNISAGGTRGFYFPNNTTQSTYEMYAKTNGTGSLEYPEQSGGNTVGTICVKEIMS